MVLKPMKADTVEKLVWALIYGGLGIAMLGLWALRGGADFGPWLAALGGLLVAAGVVLVWVRSRMVKAADGAPGAPR